MHATEGTGALELIQVTTDGLGGDLEATGEFDDADATLVEQQPLDEFLALHCVHANSSVNFPHVTTQSNMFATPSTVESTSTRPLRGR